MRQNVRFAGLMLGLSVWFLLGVDECAKDSAEQRRVIELVNASRAQYGRAAVAWHPDASQRADAWAHHMAQIGRLEHSNMDWCYASKHGGHCSENIGYGGSIDAVHTAYMNSTPHRNNLLDPGCYHIGAGYYNANGRIYTVHQFECR